MDHYSVKQLSDLAGVSVRTLHLYDEIGLLKPSVRTASGYRRYGEKELLRLQQILFYKALDIPLQNIASILDDPEYDVVEALGRQKELLEKKKEAMTVMLNTIDKTISKLKHGTTMTHEELYKGLPKEQAEARRKEAIDKYGAEAVDRSESSLMKMKKEDFEKLKSESEAIWQRLMKMTAQDPASDAVQKEIASHYIIIRKFWGTENLPDKQFAAYAGLGELYVNDDRYTMTNGKPNPQFAKFMKAAMTYFADRHSS